MIGKLKGIIDEIDKDFLIIDVNGVGYLVFCSPRTMRSLSNKGELVSLIIETQVREDNITLFGFKDVYERDWFRALITVQGIGARVAFAIIGAIPLETLANVIAASDKAAFKQVSGVGPKLADRIFAELKDKVTSFTFEKSTQSTNINIEPSLLNDTVSALANLGYSRAESYNVVNRLIALEPEINVGELIRKSLKEFAK